MYLSKYFFLFYLNDVSEKVFYIFHSLIFCEMFLQKIGIFDIHNTEEMFTLGEQTFIKFIQIPK